MGSGLSDDGGFDSGSETSFLNLLLSKATGALAFLLVLFAVLTLDLVKKVDLAIRTTALPPARAGEPYRVALAAVGGAPPHAWRVDGLPAGLAADAAGVISGSPGTARESAARLDVSLRDGRGKTVTRRLALDVLPPAIRGDQLEPLELGTTALPPLVQAKRFEVSLAARGGTGRYRFAVEGTLPPGIAFDPARGVLAGVPGGMGKGRIEVSVEDLGPAAVVRRGRTRARLDWMVLPPSVADEHGRVPPLEIGMRRLAPAIAGRPYECALAATGIPPLAWTCGGLPPGLRVEEARVLGVAQADGTFQVSVSVEDGLGRRAAASVPILVHAEPAAEVQALRIVSRSLPTATAGREYSVALSAAGGVLPYTWRVSGLPRGLALTDPAAGVVEGRPAEAGRYSLQVEVAASGDVRRDARATLSLGVGAAPAPLEIATESLPAAVAGEASAVQVAARGGSGSYRYELLEAREPDGRPAAARIDGASGLLTVVAPNEGRTALRIAALDARSEFPSARATRDLTLTARRLVPPEEADQLRRLLEGERAFFRRAVWGLAAGLIALAVWLVLVGPPLRFVIRGPVRLGGSGAALAVRGGTGRYRFAPGDDRVQISPDGVMTPGKAPGAGGPFTVEVRVRSGLRSSSATIEALPPSPDVGPLRVLTDALPRGRAGFEFTLRLAAAGGAPPYRWSAKGAPPGTEVDENGRISGVPFSAAGLRETTSVDVSLEVEDAAGARDARELRWTIDPNGAVERSPTFVYVTAEGVTLPEGARTPHVQAEAALRDLAASVDPNRGFVVGIASPGNAFHLRRVQEHVENAERSFQSYLAASESDAVIMWERICLERRVAEVARAEAARLQAGKERRGGPAA